MKAFLYIPGDAKIHAEVGKYLQSLTKPQIIKIVEKRPIHSLKERGYYRIMLATACLETGEYSTDRLHTEFKDMFNNGESTSGFDDVQHAAYNSKVKMWLEDNLNVKIKDKRDTTYQEWLEIDDKFKRTAG